MLHSFDLEQRLLAGLLKYPEKYTEISSFIDENDFWSEGSKINRTLFLVLRQIIENGDEIDEIIVSERVSRLGISFTDNSNPSEYIESLSLKKISPESVSGIARELKRYTVRREISSCGQTLSKKMASMSPSADLDTIVQLADQIYNDQINLYENGSDKPENIFESMEDLVEERGNNPVDEFGFSGPVLPGIATKPPLSALCPILRFLNFDNHEWVPPVPEAAFPAADFSAFNSPIYRILARINMGKE